MRGKATRRKMREAKLAAQQQNEEVEPSYSSGKYNETDPFAGKLIFQVMTATYHLLCFYLKQIQTLLIELTINASLAQLLLKSH